MAPLLHWPLVLIPLLLAVGALFALLLFLERRAAGRELTEQEKLEQAERQHHADMLRRFRAGQRITSFDFRSRAE